MGWLDDVPMINWNNFEEAAQKTQQIVTRLAKDKAYLRELLCNVEHNQDMFKKAESHHLLDRIEIYNADDRNFRVRLHVSTKNHLDRPHNHRFSFSSYILRGSYQHTWNKLNREMDDNVTLDDLVPLHIANETAGHCYSLHHSVVHTTYTTPDTVSIFLRGPAESDRSIILDELTGRLWWRHSQPDENKQRREKIEMGTDHYRSIIKRMEDLGVIEQEVAA